MTSHDPVRIGLVAASDRASTGVYKDEGIPALEQWLAGALLNPLEFERRLIPDERVVIEATLKELVDERRCDLVITTGGTGPAARDVTPEATLAVGEDGLQDPLRDLGVGDDLLDLDVVRVQTLEPDGVVAVPSGENEAGVEEPVLVETLDRLVRSGPGDEVEVDDGE